MDFSEQYIKQVQLLVNVLPEVAKQDCFALKGGTAINLFLRNLPRLSVDIDLTYLPIEPRAESLKGIDTGMKSIKNSLEAFGYKVSINQLANENVITRLIVSNGKSTIKIETSPVLRGAVHPALLRAVTKAVEQDFGFAEVTTLDFNDLYAGKLCAALDRQHPRDIFDIKQLLENEGISETLKNTFLVYLISHNRPMAELLAPNWQPLEGSFEAEFTTMTKEPITLAELENTRVKMLKTLRLLLTEEDKNFLISIKEGKPNWGNFYYPEVQYLPAVQWKQHNIHKMSLKLRRNSLKILMKSLGDEN